jgi:hypothetical protein
MRGAIVALTLLGACSFKANEVGVSGAIDAPGHDSPGPGGDGSGSGSGSGSAAGAFRKSLTIDKAKVTGNNADFPVWIDLTDADIASRAQADGSDIFFTDSNGAVLDHELVRFNRNTQRVLAWVRVPNLAMAANTVLYVVYGDASRAVAQNAPGVFKSSFGAVWHLDDALNTAAIADATGTHPGTATGLTSASQINGQLGPGVAFDGSGTHSIAFTNMLNGSNAHTISAWVNQVDVNAHSPVVVIGTAMTDRARFMYANYLDQDSVGVGQYSDDWIPSGYDLRGQGWKYEVYTLEGSNKKTHLFVDGVEVAGSPHTMNAAANTSSTSGLIGAAPTGFLAAEMDGSLDEVRIATVARAPGWIATEFANQSAPGSFYAVGSEEPAP